MFATFKLDLPLFMKMFTSRVLCNQFLLCECQAIPGNAALISFLGSQSKAASNDSEHSLRTTALAPTNQALAFTDPSRVALG